MMPTNVAARMTLAADPGSLQGAVAAGILGAGRSSSARPRRARGCSRRRRQQVAAGGAPAAVAGRDRARDPRRRRARCRASAIRCTGRSTRAPSGSSSSPTRAASAARTSLLARALRDAVARGLGQAADDERLDADRGGDARPRLPGRGREGRPDPRAHGRPARPPRRGAASTRSASSWRGRRRRRSSTSAGRRRTDARARGRDPPWDEQLALDDASYRAQLAYLFERSAFYREKLAAAGFGSPAAAGGLADIAQPAADREARAPGDRARRTTRSARISARRPSEIVRIYSTSGTTGTPSYIPLTAGDLDNWVTGSARSYAASGIAAGQRIVSTYNAGPVRRRRRARRVRPHRPLPHPGRHRQHRAPDDGDRAAAARRRRADALRTPPTSSNGQPSAASTSAGSSVERVLVAGEPGGGEPAFRAKLEEGWGAQGHRGDGHRRHRRLALGRVRGAGRDAPRRARLRPRRADRPRDGRRARARRRRHRRARAHAPPASRGAAAALPHARPRRGPDEPVPRAAAPARACAASGGPTTCSSSAASTSSRRRSARS